MICMLKTSAVSLLPHLPIFPIIYKNKWLYFKQYWNNTRNQTNSMSGNKSVDLLLWAIYHGTGYVTGVGHKINFIILFLAKRNY